MPTSDNSSRKHALRIALPRGPYTLTLLQPSPAPTLDQIADAVDTGDPTFDESCHYTGAPTQLLVRIASAEFRALVTPCARVELRASDGELDLRVTTRRDIDTVTYADSIANHVYKVIAQYQLELAANARSEIAPDPYRPLPAAPSNSLAVLADQAKVDEYENRPASRYNNLVARTGKMLDEYAASRATIAAGIDTSDAGLERFRRERRRGPAFMAAGVFTFAGGLALAKLVHAAFFPLFFVGLILLLVGAHWARLGKVNVGGDPFE